MATVKISALTTGTPKGTDETPAVDTTDTTQATSGTTKKYFRWAELNFYLTAQGLTTYAAVLASSTGALTATYSNGTLGVGATLTNSGAQVALTLDGVTLAVSDRVLIKNQAAPAQNGIYTVTTVGTGATNWVLTRATDYDQAAEIVIYGVVLVDQGTISAGLLYQETGAGPWTMGTTAITFAVYNTAFNANAVLLNPIAAQTINGAFNLIMATGSLVAPTVLPGNLSLSGNTLSSTNSNGNIYIATNGNGNYVIGNASTLDPVSSAANVVSVVGRPGTSQGSLRVYSYFNSTATGGTIQLNKSRSTTIGSFTTVQTGDTVGSINVTADNGTAYTPVASIVITAGTVAGLVVPGIITMSTRNGAGVTTTALTLDSAQILTLANALPVGSGGLGITTTPSNGFIPIGNGTNYVSAAITAGTGISVTNGSGTITLASTGVGSVVWNDVAGTTQTAAVNSGYIISNAGQTTVTLPTTAAEGSVIAIAGKGAAGWIMQAAAGQTIHYGSSATSVAGSLTSINQWDSVTIVCVTANTTFSVIASQGNLTAA